MTKRLPIIVLGLTFLLTPLVRSGIAHAQLFTSPQKAWSGCTNVIPNPTTGVRECVAEQISLADCSAKGNCGVEHFFILFDGIIRWAAGAAGVIALFAFVMGGMWMIFSAGNSSRVERGKEIVKGSTLALFWILGSWLLISFVLQALNVTQGTLTNKDTLQYSDCQKKKNGASCGDPNTDQCYNGACIAKCAAFAREQGRQAFEFSCKPFASCVPSYATMQACIDAPTKCQQGICANTTDVCC